LTNNLGKLSNMITSTGSAVGIGQPSPSYTLDVSGSLRATTSAYFATSSGSVGIGTSSPNRPLEIVPSTGVVALRINNTAVSGNAGIEILTAASKVSWLLGAQYNVDQGFEITPSTANGGTTFSSPALVIKSTGNVGIGTSSPNIIGFTGTMLTVNGTGNYQGLEIATSGTSRMTITADSSGTYGIISTRQTGMYLIFEVGAASEAMRINPSKQIGINSANTSARLNMTFGGAGQNGFSMLDGDNTVNATFIDFKNSSGTIIGSISRSGGTNAVLYNTTSDYRLKEDLRDFNGLEEVMAIKVYDFNWIGTNERTNGVIAHELAEILPFAVTGKKDKIDEEGNIIYQSVDYSKIVPSLTKAIQEQQTQIEELSNRLNKAGL